MGRSSRPRPKYLGKKLLRIRDAFGLTQEEMVKRLAVKKEGLTHSSISGYELGAREPSLRVLLEYARLANVHLEVLADDTLELPSEIPSRKTHGGVRRLGRAAKRQTSG
ncbi:MAG: helix-turn-helix transcriptional regulator [Acidobacteria bacterium]|nr:helix-turn-helix transcriptional regulator [Acidobacteriota bacterium]